MEAKQDCKCVYRLKKWLVLPFCPTFFIDRKEEKKKGRTEGGKEGKKRGRRGRKKERKRERKQKGKVNVFLGWKKQLVVNTPRKKMTHFLSTERRKGRKEGGKEQRKRGGKERMKGGKKKEGRKERRQKRNVNVFLAWKKWLVHSHPNLVAVYPNLLHFDWNFLDTGLGFVSRRIFLRKTNKK